MYASSLRESRLHRCCNRIARKDAGLDCLDCKDKSGKLACIKRACRLMWLKPVCRFFAKPMFRLAQLSCSPPAAMLSVLESFDAHGAGPVHTRHRGRLHLRPLWHQSRFADLPHTKAVPLPKHSVLAYIPVLLPGIIFPQH